MLLNNKHIETLKKQKYGKNNNIYSLKPENEKQLNIVSFNIENKSDLDLDTIYTTNKIIFMREYIVDDNIKKYLPDIIEFT